MQKSFEHIDYYLQLTSQLLKNLNKKTNWTTHMVEQLQATIHFHQYVYYQKNHAYISDEEFDKLFAKIKSFEVQPINNKSVSSQVVGGGFKPMQEQEITHHRPMLSLENAFSSNDLIDFNTKVIKTLEVEKVTYIIEPKIDGLSLSLYYEDDKFIYAATRGNGLEGDNVSFQIGAITTIPSELKLSQHGIKSCEIRGEIYISNKDFAAINAKLIDDNKSPFTNPRNVAAGGLRLKEMDKIKFRRLSVVFYRMIIIDGKLNRTSHFETIYFLDKVLHLPTPINYIKKCKTIEEVINWCHQFEEERSQFPFNIDGVVIKIDDFDFQDRIGQTSHHPKWAIAYKLKAQSKESKIVDVKFQIGRTGILTPVAKVEPVAIAGAIISSVSLFNEDFIREKKILLGDTVTIERSGDVIPYITHVVFGKRTGNEIDLRYPKDCPVCHTPLIKQDAAWCCPNTQCESQIVQTIVHFVSKDSLNIKGLGEQIIKRLWSEKIIFTVADIFRLPFERIQQLDGFGVKLTSNLMEAIEKAKSTSMDKILYGLGMRHVGINTAKKITQHINELQDLSYFSLEQLQQIEDIGPKVAKSIYDYFNNLQYKILLQELEQLGLSLNIKASSQQRDSLKLAGKTFLFSGSLMVLSRDVAFALIKKNGGTISKTVSKKVDILIAGENAGSKLEKASSISSIQIWDENQFIQFLNNNNISTLK